MKTFRLVTALALACAAAPLAAQQAAPTSQEAQQADWRESYAYAVGMQAVVYGYPIMLNVRQRYFQVEKPMGVIDTPINAWFYSPRVPNSDDKYGISPSDNLYYSLAWFDVSKEPLVITVPDAGTRYYSIQMMEMYTDIFGYVGKRETGNKAASYLLVGPGWKGKLPKGIAAIRRSPTPKGALLMRILVDSRDNLEVPKALARRTAITPLSNWLSGKKFVPGERNVVDFVPAQSGDPFWFFRNVNRGMTENPPPASDEALLRAFREVGIGAGIGENFEALDPATQRGLKRAQADGIAMIVNAAVGAANTKVVNHWAYGTSNWGRTARDKDFLTRASTQGHAGWQEHWIEEVVKLRAHHDGDGQLLNGNNRYELRFAPGEIPKVGAFWSVTLYDDKYNLSANSLGRYSLGSPELAKMKHESDGSVILHIQADPPSEDRMANWLPAPRGSFNLLLASLSSRRGADAARLCSACGKESSMRLLHSVAIGALLAAGAFALAGAPEAPAEAATAKQSTVKLAEFPQRPLWGDLHLHTANSFDAFTAGLRLGPEDALRFARGEGVKTANGEVARLHRPLDFLAVTDHAEAIGSTAHLYNTPEDQIKDPTLKRWRAMMHTGGDEAYKAFRQMVTAAASGTLPAEFADPAHQQETSQRVWGSQLDAVERYNEPGKFTALVGFEYSLQPRGNTLHRNVIFRDGADKARTVLPFASDGKKGPEPLWDYMDAYARATGGKMLAIPHNPNLSNGMAFMETHWDGSPLTAEMARRRAAHEPLVEVTQYKGDSESHPGISRNDEFADFGDAGWENGNAPLTTLKQQAMLGGEYVREVLKRGLLIEARTGINPYMLGMIGSTDSHTALSSFEEDNFAGKFSNEGPGADRVNAVVNPGIKESRIGWQYQAGGLAAVWANANTREAIFDALARREVYATTGSRMTVRVFAGWNFTARDLGGDWVRAGYARGVPMGGMMKPGPKKSGSAAPSLMISAAKDPQGANLDRVQVIKGWVDAKGEAHEKIYDVAWSSPGKRRIANGKLTPVGDTVDLRTATYRNSIGAPALNVVWRDPEFQPSQRAFYYVRVLEIPTPRWVAYDVVKYGAKPPKDARLKDQERAYTSPIWYRPQS